MKILVDSDEYKCWHEVGHAIICLHLHGDVECIEFLNGHSYGHARASCVVLPEMERSVACGGFAAEFYLLKNGYAEQRHDDKRNINEVVFHNAIIDRAAFWDREVDGYPSFTTEEDEKFRDHAIEIVAPIFDEYFPRMQALVRELYDARRVEGKRVKELLRIGASR